MSSSIVGRATAVALTLAGALGVTACTSTTPRPRPVPTNLAPGLFVLQDGVEHDACGIGLVLKFIPPTAHAAADYALVFGGPVGNVGADTGNLTADGDWPDNTAHPQHGTTFQVAGRRFGVAEYDRGSSWMVLEPLC